MVLTLTEPQKRYLRKVNGTTQRWAQDRVVNNKPKIKPIDDCLKADWKPCKLRGASGTRLSEAKRAMVSLRRGRRAAFLSSV